MEPQIVTLTMNPALDLACKANAVQPVHKIRTFDELLDPGGGGINVARVVHALGGDALALILTGGVTGRLVEQLLDQAGVRWRALPIGALTRISLNVRDLQGGCEYRFVPEGPKVTAEEWGSALEVLHDIDAEWIVASSSLPRGVPADFYARAAAVAASREQKFVLDTSGPALRAAIGHDLHLLKLSLGELEFLLDHPVRDPQQQERETAALVAAGVARMIAVSLGRDGAILATTHGVERTPSLRVRECSAVGAGDSFLAGLVLGLLRGMPHHQALALGVAAGSAAVSSNGTAQVERAAVDRLYRQLCGAGAAASAA